MTVRYGRRAAAHILCLYIICYISDFQPLLWSGTFCNNFDFSWNLMQRIDTVA